MEEYAILIQIKEGIKETNRILFRIEQFLKLSLKVLEHENKDEADSPQA